MGDFSGIDPQAMLGMISAYKNDKEQLRAGASALRPLFAAAGLDTSAFSELLGICGWLDDQTPMLERRQRLAAAIDKAHPAGPKPAQGMVRAQGRMVRVAEPVEQTSAQAQQSGKDLADESNKDDDGDGAEYQKIAQQLAEHQDDPDYCAAFYAELNPDKLIALPTLLVQSGDPTAKDDLKTFSIAFGSATRATSPPAGFEQAKDAFLTPVESNGAGWDRVAMLQYGDFDSSFLAQATRASVLDRLTKDPDQDFRGSLTEAAALGLSPDTVLLNLQVLSDHGDAVRTAFGQGTDPGLTADLKALTTYVQTQNDPALLAAFKADLTAGSGDVTAHGPYGSYPAATAHSAPEADFAAAAMSALRQSHADYATYQDWIESTFTAYGVPPDATTSVAGSQDAFLLRLAVSADPSWPSVRPAIQAVADDADASKDDLDYMKGFYDNGGDRSEALVALTLHSEDGTQMTPGAGSDDGTVQPPDVGTVLNKASTDILAKFGDSLAAATKLQTSRQLPDLTETFTKPQDMWSASMLLKYGPDGSDWDPTFLGAMSDAVLHWGADREVMPRFSPPDIGYGVTEFMYNPADPWYAELGLTEDVPGDPDLYQQMAIAQTVADNDPRLAVLARLAQNQTAARDLLSGSNGAFAAGQLVSKQWQLPEGYGDNSATPAAVIIEATDITGDKDRDLAAAQDAARVFQASVDNYTPAVEPTYGLGALPPKLANALAKVAGNYAPELADSVENNAADLGFTALTNGDGRPTVLTNPTALNVLLHSFMSGNPAAAGTFRGLVHADITTVALHGQPSDTATTDILDKLGRLDGSISNVMSDLTYRPAQLADAQAVQDSMYVWTIAGLAGPLIPAEPLLPDVVSKLVSMANGGGSAFLSYQFPTDHATNVEITAQNADSKEERYLRVPVAEGLIKAGRIPPPNATWYHDGHIDLKNDQDMQEFDRWRAELPSAEKTLLDSLTTPAQMGFNAATKRSTGNTDDTDPGGSSEGG